jgi:hypothetical protein
MATESRHVSTFIDRPAAEVYAYAGDPANLPSWAAGLSGSIEQIDGEWIADSPLGRVIVEFVGPNDLGVLDHRVTVPSGETFYNPLRVLADGPGAEIVFTVRRQDTMSDADFERDVAAVSADLATLKALLERP